MTVQQVPFQARALALRFARGMGAGSGSNKGSGLSREANISAAISASTSGLKAASTSASEIKPAHKPSWRLGLTGSAGTSLTITDKLHLTMSGRYNTTWTDRETGKDIPPLSCHLTSEGANIYLYHNCDISPLPTRVGCGVAVDTRGITWRVINLGS